MIWSASGSLLAFLLLGHHLLARLRERLSIRALLSLIGAATALLAAINLLLKQLITAPGANLLAQTVALALLSASVLLWSRRTARREPRLAGILGNIILTAKVLLQDLGGLNGLMLVTALLVLGLSMLWIYLSAPTVIDGVAPAATEADAEKKSTS